MPPWGWIFVVLGLLCLGGILLTGGGKDDDVDKERR
jgi:hypothetical protein